MRAQNDSRHPMIISVISNFLNIGGNAILIFVLHMGVAGAAISTLVSRIFCAVVVIWELRNEKNPISIRNYLAIRPDFSSIKKILCIGIPSGMFLLIEAVRRKPVKPEHEGIVHLIGMALLMMLIVAVTFSDIKKLIG